ncbi:hypothetical protein K435DRAFT_778746 [Dendrothele bispora CBS 962.96]|uniref:Putative gamma-glutamylcyclotransferase n=1 Tax=Dendrothele bispora (strain CBS 962.96) TaxID=1314807 RepID=A0A4S8M1S1_DENBC|nr:hypothetical protein K435DRAFT_778746 [Dendrothele bispora CBS 962.96]
MSSAFFYGTLMHPKILKRVIRNNGAHLNIAPAVLLEHTRHNVKDADFPGILPYEKARHLFEQDLNDEEKCVRGTLVSGLTKKDIRFLDKFEGSLYVRVEVDVHPLGPFSDLSHYSSQNDASIIPSDPEPLPSVLTSSVKAQTYVFLDSSEVEAELWSFEDFVRNHSSNWY